MTFISYAQNLELASARTGGAPAIATLAPTAPCVPPPDSCCVYFDASLILHFGCNPPMGIVRVEQYVAQILAGDASISLSFLLFDQSIKAYRALRPDEQARLNDILFHRYEARKAAKNSPSEHPHTITASPVDAEKLRIVEVRAAARGKPARRNIFLKLLTTARITREVFAVVLSERLTRLLPVRQEHSLMRRVATRILRRSLFATGRGGHFILSRLASSTRTLFNLARVDAASHAPRTVLPRPTRPKAKPIGAFPFAQGDVLITMANTWDYMDYGYLTRIVRRDGVRLISVIYDVIAMEMPFTTPASVHVYHRHWVELGHLATHLVAISRHSLQSYQHFIGEPNDLAPPMSYAYLPNFLYERRHEIGETVVPSLLDRRFVVFCSTIEARKNHQLLLHLWERLRQEIDSGTLPILVLVGSWGWGVENVRLLSERNWRLRDHLRILDGLSDAQLIWLYRNACFTVFPSHSEGFGLAAAESLSFGTPVVVANCSALIEATEGLMPAYDPLDLPNWLAEMRRLIVDSSSLTSLRRKAAQYKGAHYTDFAYAIRDAILASNQHRKASA